MLAWSATIVACALLMMLFFSPDLAFSGRYLAGLFQLAGPAAGAPLEWAGVTLLVLALLFLGHASEVLVDLPRLWQRIGVAGRVAAFVLGSWVALAWRAPEVEPFVYFSF